MINFAHRGASNYYPENTMVSLKEGIKTGANGLEIDVHKTKDNKLVVIHDEDIQRTFKGKGLVKDMTLEELRRFKCRNKNFENNIECRIPTLEEVLDLVKETNVILNIELKTDKIHYEGIERDVIELVNRHGLKKQIVLSSFNHESIRICREIIGSSNKIMNLITNNNRVYNTLIVSPPKCGKTTILRDIAKNISNGMYKINLSGKKVTIVDERSEIAACYNGVPQMNVGIRTDILDNCLKKSGMIMAIRSLSPEVLICDEIGTEGDLEALNMAFNSGVNVIVTVHGYDINDVYNRKVFKELIDNCVLERIILLSNRRGAGTIEKVYKVSRERGLQCLEI